MAGQVNKMKKIAIFILLATVGMTVWAQEENEILRAKQEYFDTVTLYNAEDPEVVIGKHGNGWLRSYLFDNWFIQAQGGGQLYYGTEDRKGLFKDRLTANGEMYVGRRLFPMLGFRAGGGYGYAHGFLSKDTYNANRQILLDHGFSGRCGNDENGDPLGGYYWQYDADSTLLIQKWKYWYVGFDVFMDLDFLRDIRYYNPDKNWTHVVYAGVNTKFAQSETDTTNHRSEMHLGYICRYNFNRNWSIYGDLRGSLVERLFDREWAGGTIEPVVGIGDFVLNAQVGVAYHFHFRTEEQRRDLKTFNNPTGAIDTSHYFSYHRMSTSRYLVIEDSINDCYKDTVMPPPEKRAFIERLENELNDMIARDKLVARDMKLNEILRSNVLPWEMVFFELDRWDIQPSEEQKIAAMARVMKVYPNETFILTGSADSKTGTVNRNWFLSHNRADVVYHKLINKYGVNPDQLKRVYLGGILDYEPYQLNRCTVIIMDVPNVQKAFEEMKASGGVGSGNIEDF